MVRGLCYGRCFEFPLGKSPTALKMQRASYTHSPDKPLGYEKELTEIFNFSMIIIVNIIRVINSFPDLNSESLANLA